jgi:hypothetical protein
MAEDDAPVNDGRPKPRGRKGGRPLGSPNKRRQYNQLALMEEYECLPLDFLLRLLNMRNPYTNEPLTTQEKSSKKSPFQITPERLLQIATIAAPYVHTRYAQVKFTSEKQIKHQLDLSKLNNEEIQMVKFLTAKAAVPVMIDNEGREVVVDNAERKRIEEEGR